MISKVGCDIGKAWKEMIHEYIAGALGIFIFIITFYFIKLIQTNFLTFISNIIVIMQAALGAFM